MECRTQVSDDFAEKMSLLRTNSGRRWTIPQYSRWSPTIWGINDIQVTALAADGKSPEVDCAPRCSTLILDLKLR